MSVPTSLPALISFSLSTFLSRTLPLFLWRWLAFSRKTKRQHPDMLVLQSCRAYWSPWEEEEDEDEIRGFQLISSQCFHFVLACAFIDAKARHLLAWRSPSDMIQNHPWSMRRISDRWSRPSRMPMFRSCASKLLCSCISESNLLIISSHSQIVCLRRRRSISMYSRRSTYDHSWCVVIRRDHTCIRGVVTQGVHLPRLHHVIESTNQTPAQQGAPFQKIMRSRNDIRPVDHSAAQSKNSAGFLQISEFRRTHRVCVSLSEEQTRHVPSWCRAFCVHLVLSFLAMMGVRVWDAGVGCRT